MVVIVIVPEHINDDSRVARRTILRAAVWSVPVVATTVAVPARAASLEGFVIIAAANTFRDYLYVTVTASPFAAAGANSWSFTTVSGEIVFVPQTTRDATALDFHYYTLRFPDVASFTGGTRPWLRRRDVLTRPRGRRAVIERPPRSLLS